MGMGGPALGTAEWLDPQNRHYPELKIVIWTIHYVEIDAKNELYKNQVDNNIVGRL